MVSRDREDRAVIGPIGFVKLIVIVLVLAEVVDDIAQVKKESRAIEAAVLDVGCHGVGDSCLMSNSSCLRLQRTHFGRPCVSNGVKCDLSCRLDGTENLDRDKVAEVQRHVSLAGRDSLTCIWCSVTR